MLPVTTAIAALAAICLVGLSVSVSLCRMKAGVRIGFGEDESLMRRIRAQGNFTEYVPLALIILGIAEYRETPPPFLWSIAALLVVGRALHVGGILTGRSAIRAPGMIGTYGALLVGAGALIFG